MRVHVQLVGKHISELQKRTTATKDRMELIHSQMSERLYSENQQLRRTIETLLVTFNNPTERTSLEQCATS